ncbi:MAG: glutathione S-transferase family protein [Gammaproteobacteria bacterium]|nr:glutathione S-transferase family protein [Gammaproteobacteria bacterium]
MTLYIGNHNYSSWSLRPWILLRHLGLEFTEVTIPLDQPDTRARILEINPAGKLPLLRHGALDVWESLAICEYACELAGAGLPRDAAARAVARSLAAEMHAGFLALRSAWPMNARATGRRTPRTPELAADLARIESLWTACRRRHGRPGPWLFGDYSLADAMYAPVALRLRTYGATPGGAAGEYLATVLADPHLADWITAARAEPWIIAAGEVGSG